MQIQFQLSFDDYLAAQRLHQKRSLWARLNFILNYYLLPPVWPLWARLRPDTRLVCCVRFFHSDLDFLRQPLDFLSPLPASADEALLQAHS
jgi:hypothetical protein